MPRADLLKKLFSNFKHNDSDAFLTVAYEIIDDERKKNHDILADDLKKILINGNSIDKKALSTFKTNSPKDENKDAPLIETIYPEKYFADLVLKKEKKEQLNQIVIEFNNWDVLVSNGVYPTRKVLFFGPPGCGKTLSAQAISSEIGIPMLYVRFDAVVSSFLGETASNIRRVFDYAKNDSWIIFFDEFDAIGRSRNDLTEHGEIKRVVNTFLQQIDNFMGRSLVIAATNFEKSLDYAIWRRFDETIQFDQPSNDEKRILFSQKLRRFDGPEHTFDSYIEDLKDFSHSDVEKVTQIIMKRCILDGRKIYTKKDVDYAIKKQVLIVSMRKTHY
jgi:AAA+ superfamily predicted ATPase